MHTDLETLAAGRWLVTTTDDGTPIIPCDGGRVTAAPDGSLLVELPRGSKAASQLRRHPGVTTEAIGREVITFGFPAALFPSLVPILRPQPLRPRSLRSRFPAEAHA